MRWVEPLGSLIAPEGGRARPQFAEALMMLGQVAYERGDSDLAIRSMETASARVLVTAISQSCSVGGDANRRCTTRMSKGRQRISAFCTGRDATGIGDRVARVLEREYGRIGKTLNSFPTETTTVILYTNREFTTSRGPPRGRQETMMAASASRWVARSRPAISIARDT